jgi:hypothetical protein
VLSRTRRVPKGGSFSIGDRTLGELGHGDLKALVRLDGPPVPSNHLTIEWRVNGIVMDRQRPISPDSLIEYDNEPTSGSYRVIVRLDGQTVDEFLFQIDP